MLLGEDGETVTGLARASAASHKFADRADNELDTARDNILLTG